MEIWLKSDSESLQIPVLPSEFEVEVAGEYDNKRIVKGKKVDVFNGEDLETATLESFFPADPNVPYASCNGILDPYSYVDTIKKWVKEGTVLRYIVTDTNINMSCRIKSFSFREQDGTGDVYYSISIQEHNEVKFTKVKKQTEKKPSTANKGNRPSKPASTNKQVRYYTVKKGDCLWNISKKYYGKGSDYNKIFNANKDKIKNPSLIYPGQKFVIP